MLNNETTTVIDILEHRARNQPDRQAYIFLLDGETEELHLTYQELDLRARAIAAQLQQMGATGERALLLYPSGLEFISAFFGCLYAGIIAVPTYPPRRNRPDQRLQAIATDSQATIALTTSAILSDIDRLLIHTPELKNLQWLATDVNSSKWQEPALVSPDTLAFLQYTSGSTGKPKGVMVTHGNLLHNEQMIKIAFQHTEKTIFVGWLPLFHDMGLIGNVLQPLYLGIPCILMSPIAFLQKPVRWLQAISRYKATTSGAPNFAYDLCVQKITPQQRESLDLSSWEVAFNGAEPVRAETLERFAATFESCGFRYSAFYPCYGMAETTLLVSGGLKTAPPILKQVEKAALELNKVISVGGMQQELQPLVGCGQSKLELAIVDPKSLTKCAVDQVGEIWVSGASVAPGYWNRAEETMQTFQAYTTDTREGPFLRTGDLGFLHDGELFVTGRLKDLIIIRGHNHYPQDIELTVEKSHPAVRPGSCAAFSLFVSGEERLVVCAEVKRTFIRKLDVDKVVSAIRRAVSERQELQLYAVLLLKTGTIPKTSSGKIQRHACRVGLEKDTLSVVGEWKLDLEIVEQVETHSELPFAPSAKSIQKWIVNWLARTLQIPVQSVDPKQAFADYGLNSVMAVELAGELSEWLPTDIELDPTLAWNFPTIESLVYYIQYIQASSLVPRDKPSTDSTELRALKEPIAIIGMGCRFPGGADGPRAYWRLLSEGIEGICEVPSSRWDLNAFHEPTLATAGFMRWGGFLSEIDQFDPQFFGISPREAESMDPQQRLLLEVSWEALENAGIAPEKLSGSKSGVFIGISSHDYSHLQDAPTAYTGTGNAFSIAANRLSYLLDLRGPSWAVDTACSSSLVAVHQAVMSLRQGECELALAGGVNLILSPHLTMAFSQAGMMAADGRCKTFDASADGYVRGEGCGIVVLKRLSDAVRDGDRILALIRGSAVNQDGRSNGLTAPNGLAQQAVIRQALENADVPAEQISYIEAHGTGTSLGDPIEVNSLKEVLITGRREPYPKGTLYPEGMLCFLGSAKTNIGHLEAAAGIAGLIKVVLSLQHEQIPPLLHLKELNPHISIEGTPLSIPTESRPWPLPQKIRGAGRLAGVSSFGFGGTNAHVILEEAPAPAEPFDKLWNRGRGGEQERGGVGYAPATRPKHILTLSAKSESALRELAQRYDAYLSSHAGQEVSLTDFCYTANTGRSHFEHRLAVVTESTMQLREQLSAFVAGKSSVGVIKGQAQYEHPKIAFLFTGQGSQYIGMSQQLYETQPTFRQVLDECDELLRPYLASPLLSVLYSANQPTNQPTNQLDETAYTQPALFALEYALAKLWESWGVVPDVVMGHSVGELVAACVAGVFSLEDGLKLVAERGRLMQLCERGEMVAVFASEAQVSQAIGQYAEEVATACPVGIAAINGPQSVVISGQTEAVHHVVAEFALDGIKTKRLTVSHAFHSPLMEPILADFLEVARQACPEARGISYFVPKTAFISNITGQLVTHEVATPEYWVRHVRQPVRFGAGMASLVEQGATVFVEIGPKPVLLGMGRRLYDEPFAWLPSLRQGREEWSQLLESLAQLYVRGVEIDWVGFSRDYARRKIVLPTYPFQRERYWLERPTRDRTRSVGSEKVSLMPLLGKKLHTPSLGATVFESHFSTNALPFLLDHQIYDRVVVPASCHVSLLLEASAITVAEGEIGEKECLLEDMLFHQALVLDDSRRQRGAEKGRTLQLVMTRDASVAPKESETSFGATLAWQVISFDSNMTPNEKTTWVVHATGRLSTPASRFKEQKIISLQEIKARCQEEISQVEFYQALRSRKLQLGPSFRWIESIWQGDREAICKMNVPATAKNRQYQLHPGLIDSCFQLLAATFLSKAEGEEVMVPFSIERFRATKSPNSQELWCYARLREAQEASSMSGDIQLFNSAGQIMAEVVGLAIRKASPKALLRSLGENSSDWLYEIAWEAKESVIRRVEQGSEAGSWLIFAERPSSIAEDAQKGARGAKLASLLREQGEHCILVFRGQAYQRYAEYYELNPSQPQDFRRLISETVVSPSHYPKGTLSLRVVYLWGIEAKSGEASHIPITLCGSLLHLVQALITASETPRLWLVTKGSQAVTGSAQDVGSVELSIWQAPLWGMGRVIQKEYPELNCVCLDLAPEGVRTACPVGIKALFDELYSKDQEDQVAFRNDKRYVARLVRARGTTNQSLLINEEGSYLITGGLGALGLQVANYLVAQGGRHLILTGRRGAASREAQEAVKELEAKGAQVQVIKADVSNPDDVARLLKAAELPLRGIIHAAGVLDDGVLMEQSLARFEKVMVPKVQGAWNLHQLTRKMALDFFVLFSSAASLLGSAGQANYAAANAFMDGLAHYRHSLGLPALSINWGPWADYGMAANVDLRVAGMRKIAPERGLQVFGELIQSASLTQVGVLPVNWSKFRQQFPRGHVPPLFSQLLLNADDAREARAQQGQPFDKLRAPLRRQLEEATPNARQDLLMAYLEDQVARILGHNGRLNPKQGFFEMGLDSLMGLELRSRLQSTLGVSLSSTLALDYSNLEDLTDYLSGILSPTLAVALAPESKPTSVLEEVRQLSEDELDMSIEEELAKLEASLKGKRNE